MMKRLLDLLSSAVGMILLSPLLTIIYGIVRLRLGHPAIFTQQRSGLNGKIFTFYKFRTMTDECNEEGELLPEKIRITPLGSFLRKTSLDELPSLFNVLKGDMSLVGPRPLLVEYLDLYSPEQARRHDVKPGITGWAQINGRNAISWDEKFTLDVWYVDNINLLLDFNIIIKTVLKVIKKEGISASSDQTMPRFTGPEQKA